MARPNTDPDERHVLAFGLDPIISGREEVELVPQLARHFQRWTERAKQGVAECHSATR
jgi:hypothetical protein